METTKILKLQFFSLVRIYLFFIGIIIIIAGLMFIPFDKTDNYHFRINIAHIFFFAGLIFSFFIGNFQYNPIGKIYMQLQMKRTLFPYLVIFNNILNGLILCGMFNLIRLGNVFYQNEINTSSLLMTSLHFFCWQLASYSLGSGFCLFFRKYRFSFLAFVFVILIIGFIEAGVFQKILSYSHMLFRNDTIPDPKLIIIIIYGSLLILVNIINVWKYCRSNIINAY